jgi:hypothetical protein
MVAYPLPACPVVLNREGYAASSLFPHLFVILDSDEFEPV